MNKNLGRGQLEVFGLAVIVIILTIGFFIMVSFKIREKPSEYQKKYIYEQMPSNFVNSIISVSVDNCNGQSVKQLFIDCASTHSIYCSNGGLSTTSCGELENIIGIILNRTLVMENYRFNFYTKGLARDINISNLNCQISSPEKKAKEIPIPTYPNPPGQIFMGLVLCTK
jgi:hypothetical protein